MIAPVLSTIASLLLLSNLAAALPAESAGVQTRRSEGDNPINVDEACKFQHGSAFSAQTKGNGCNDWVCVRGGERYGVDMQGWCRIMRDRENIYYGYLAECRGGVYGWVCNLESA